MSDYKRFVAYLYEYHGNTKGENRGFVRVEARNGSCQMGFQLKVISLPERTPLNVCGFVRIRDVLFGIPIGILRSGKNGISGRLLAPAVHMGDTAFSLKDLSGLLIRGPEGKIYATQWDDIPIDPGRFTTDPSVLRLQKVLMKQAARFLPLFRQRKPQLQTPLKPSVLPPQKRFRTKRRPFKAILFRNRRAERRKPEKTGLLFLCPERDLRKSAGKSCFPAFPISGPLTMMRSATVSAWI